MNLKVRLAVMNFLEFAVWGAYLTSMGNYLGKAGMGAEISWFYTIQGIVSIFMPTLMGIVADKYMQPQRLLGYCHLLAGLSMIALFGMGEASATPNEAMFMAVYTFSVAFYMPTLALSNTSAFSILKSNGLDTVKDFPPIRVFGTVGFILTMWIVNCATWDNGSFTFLFTENAHKFQYTHYQFLVSEYAEHSSLPLLLQSATVPVGEERGTQLDGDLGLRFLQALQEPRDGDVLHLLGSAGYEPAGNQWLCYSVHYQFQG